MNKVEKYINTVCSKLIFDPSLRESVKKELESHIETTLEELADEEKDEKESLELALRRIGDAEMLRDSLYSIHRRQRWKNFLIGVCAIVFGIVLMRQLFLFSMSRLNQYSYPSVRSMELKPKPNEEWMEFRIITTKFVTYGLIAYSADGGQNCIPVEFIKGPGYTRNLTRRLYPQRVTGGIRGILRRVQPTESEQAYINSYVVQNWPKYALLVDKISTFMAEHRVITSGIIFALFAALAILLSAKMRSRYRTSTWMCFMLPCSFLLFLTLSAYRWPKEFTVFFLITFIFGVIGITYLTFGIWYQQRQMSMIEVRSDNKKHKRNT